MSKAGGAGLRPRVLIVDDDADVRESTADILELAGYDVIQAVDQAQGLLKLRHDRFDLLVLDLGVDGAGLRLLEVSEQAPPIVIGISATGRQEPDPRLTVFLSKPFSPEGLLEEIARCLRR